MFDVFVSQEYTVERLLYELSINLKSSYNFFATSQKVLIKQICTFLYLASQVFQ